MKNKYKNKYILFSIPALIFLVWLGWYFSDKQVIQRHLKELTWNLGKDGEETSIDTALKLREVKKALAADVRAIISERNYNEVLPHDMIIRYLIYYRDRYDKLAVSFTELLIELPAKGEAKVSATVLVQRKKQRNDPEELTEPVELLLKKNKEEEKGGKKWQLVQATVPASLIE